MRVPNSPYREGRRAVFGVVVGRAVFGLVVIAFGTIALLGNLGLVDPQLAYNYWPLIFVVWGLARIASPRWRRGPFFGVLLIGLGSVLTLQNLGYLSNVDLYTWWPALVILAGVSMLSRGFFPRRRRWEGVFLDSQTAHDAVVNVKAVLSSSVLKNDSSALRGGSIETVMGSVDLDLRQASISGEAELQVSAVMGSVLIRVPTDWQVTVHGAPVLGSVEDRVVPAMSQGKRLVIRAEIVLGGLEIRN